MLSIKWTNRAVKQKADILTFYVKRNKSVDYSVKIEKETDKSLSFLQKNPFMGVKVKGREGVRRIIVLRTYSVFYTVQDDSIIILAYWDNRQNPKSLKL